MIRREARPAPSTARRSGRPASRLAGALAGLGVCLTAVFPASALDPGALLEAIRATEVDVARTVELRDVTIDIGGAELSVESGVMVPTVPIDGRTIEMVFVGQARFRVEAPNEIEAGQLELFTGKNRLDAPIEAAVLVAVDPDTVDRLLDRPAPRDLRPALIERVRTIHEDWLATTERRNTGTESAIFKSLVGDSAFQSYFALWCRSYELGDFVYQLDPEDVEPLTLGNFITLDVQGWERRRLERHIRIQQRKGQWLGVRLADLGAWDVWMSTPFVPSDGSALPGNVGFETERYVLDVEIKGRRRLLSGQARLEMVAQDDGRRAVTLDLYRDLEIETIHDGQGRPLFWFRSGEDIVVVLQEPSRRGERLSLDVAYGGRVLKWVGPSTWDLSDTRAWYPHCGTVDRATYDVTLHWPKKHDLVASGKRVDGGRNGNLLWERRTLDSPAIAFSFVLGDFVVEQARAGDTDLFVAFNRDLTRQVRGEIVETVSASLEYFEEVFGAYPLDHLTVVHLPRRFSQSYLGFVTLTDSILQKPTSSDSDQEWVRDTTISHELAHQWWGNLLGWWSYRDQWLSEAMASYSALLFQARDREKPSEYLAKMSAGWNESLSARTIDGRSVESLGPIVLGGRLNSSIAGDAYRSIVYRKGAVVLAMLARAVGEEAFQKMLRSLVGAAGNRVITTEAFVEAIERMSGLDLEGFSRQYIYGTGIPEVYYDYEAVAEGPDRWRMRGEARRLAEPRYEQRLSRTTRGWDLVRRIRPDAWSESTTLMVPFRLTIDDDANEETGARAHLGRLFLEGSRSEFEIDARGRPLELKFDPDGEVLARFFSADSHPKRVARGKAHDLAVQGRLEQAVATYRAALSEELGEADVRAPFPWTKAAGTRAERANAGIRLALARLYLDMQRDADAEVELDAVERLLDEDRTTHRVERDTLRSRLDLRRGNYPAAYRRLKKTLKLAGEVRAPTGWRALLLQIQLRSERLALTEAYMLLAVAAHETDHPGDFRWALLEAKDRGADVTLLELAAGAPPARSTAVGPR